MLKFKAKNILSVVKLIKKNNAKLVLVKDHGIYVMSSVEKVKDGGKRTVVYAEGYDPDIFADGGELHDACVAAVGGDDFAETLPLTPVVMTALLEGQHDLQIQVTKTQILLDLAPVGKVA